MITEEQGKGSIINKSPLENIERIAPNIYTLDIRGCFSFKPDYRPLI